MDITERIQNAIEWANKRLTLQGQELSQEQKNYLTFALSQNFTELNQDLQLLQTDVVGQSEQLKTCDHNFADVYDHTGTQIVGKKSLNNYGF